MSVSNTMAQHCGPFLLPKLWPSKLSNPLLGARNGFGMILNVNIADYKTSKQVEFIEKYNKKEKPYANIYNL